MTKIKKVSLDKIYNGSTGLAVNLEIMSNDGVFWSASLSLDSNDLKVLTTDLTWRQAQEQIGRLLLGLELDESLWNQVNAKLSNSKHRKNLTKTLALLVEMVAIKASSSGRYLGCVEYLNEYLGFNQAMFVMPTPLITIFNGGRFGDTNLDFEDYLLIPLTKNKDSFAQKIQDSKLVFDKIGQLLRASGYDSDCGVLGAYAPEMASSLEALDIMLAGVNLAGFVGAQDFGLGINVGSANLYDSSEHKYLFKLSHNYFNTANLNQLYHEWLRQYPLFYLEDPLSEHDLEGWQDLSEDFRDGLVLAGDKLFDGDISQFRKLLKYKLGNTIVLNITSANSFLELADLIKLAKKHNYQVVLSAGEAETAEDFVADFAVASNVDFVKFGALARSERVGKYNRLLIIASKLQNIV